MSQDATSGGSVQPRHFVEVVMRAHHIALLVAALHTAMREYPIIPLPLHGDRLHQRAACSGPITRIDVHMLAPQTFRTVVGVAIACDSYTAVLALEIFDAPEE